MRFAKKIHPVIACLLLPLFLSCRHEAAKPVEVTENFLQGEISHRHFLVNGKKEGLETDYFPVGTPRIERMYRNGVQNGRTAMYFPQGQLMEVQYYGENGLKDGPDSTFYQTGELQTLLTYKAGKLNGYMRKWALSGDLFYEAKYEDDRLVEENGKPVNKTE
jgi:antitoxin component YwqK of YwqJK toxin-antitoxin module